MKSPWAAVAAGRPCRAAVVVWVALTLAAPAVACAGEAELEDQPAPESAEELVGPFGRAFEERDKVGVLSPRLKEAVKDLPPFFRDSSLALHFRTMLFDAWKLDNTRQEAWAAGGWLAYESGWLADTLQVGATLYTSEPVYAPDDRDGTQILKAGQQGYGVVGQAYARLRAADHTLTLYRQTINFPYVNMDDSRMTPNTFEGAVLQGGLPWIQYGVAYLTKMKRKDDDEFHPMSVVAGAPKSNEGLVGAGARLALGPVSFGAVEYFVPDTLNIVYTEANLLLRLGADLGARIGAQFTDQRSVGAAKLTGEHFDTQTGSARVALGYGSLILTTAFSVTAHEADIRSPFGSRPGYLSLIQQNFDSAGEVAWLVGLSYDFGRLGLSGLSAYFNFAQGAHVRNPANGRPRPDEREFDLTVDYKPKSGTELIRGVWLRLRGSQVEQWGAGANKKTGTQIRAIVNYEFRGL